MEKMTLDRGFIYSPGRILHVEGKDIPYLRLSFGSIPLVDIPEAIGILNECMRAARRQKVLSAVEAS